MFYQTQVKSIIQGGVIDVHGKTLSLIGNKFVKQGDFVWTDGKVVFGHTPIRGGGILPVEPNGVPVLGWFITEIKPSEIGVINEHIIDFFAGYFTNQGNYISLVGFWRSNREYVPKKMKGLSWIVNNNHFYYHDNDKFLPDYSNYFGVAYSTNGGVIIDAEIAADTGALYTVIADTSSFNKSPKTYYSYYYRGNFSDIYPSFISPVSQNLSVMPHDYSKSITTNNLYITNFIFDRSSENNIFWQDDGETIQNTLITIKKNEEIIYEGSIFFDYINQILDEAIEKLNTIDTLADAGGLFHSSHSRIFAILVNFKIYPNGKWTALLEVIVRFEKDYTVTEEDLKETDATKKYKTFMGGVSFLYLAKMLKITSDEEVNTLREFCYFQSDFPRRSRQSQIIKNTVADFFYFPVQDEYYAKLTSYSIDSYSFGWILNSIVDKDRNKIVDCTYLAEERINNLFTNVYNINPSELCFPETWNISFIKLNDSLYLLGIRSIVHLVYNGKGGISTVWDKGQLFKISNDGKVEIVKIDGYPNTFFSNFRLRELKPISKAKK